jgi:hypothetical protein
MTDERWLEVERRNSRKTRHERTRGKLVTNWGILASCSSALVDLLRVDIVDLAVRESVKGDPVHSAFLRNKA